MAPRILATRSAGVLRCLVALTATAAVASALWADAAGAQSGTGLYEPFPEAAVKKRAQRYVERLRNRTSEPGRRYSDAELSAGVFVRPEPHGPALAPVSRTGAASGRAGDTDAGGDLALPLQAFLLTLALALPAAALTRRARARAA